MNNPNLDPLITDRTAEDVATGTEKGYYNVKDIERINSYLEYLSNALKIYANVNDLSLGQVLTEEQMRDILNAINKFRAAWYVADDTPPTPSITNWNYSKANDIEKILLALDEFYQASRIDKIYSGTFRSGNQIKFRGAK